MVFIITLVLMMAIYGVLWLGVFLWARNGGRLGAYRNDPEKHSQLLQTPMPKIWRLFLQTPIRLLGFIVIPGPVIFAFSLIPVIQGVVWTTVPGTVTMSQVIPNIDSTGYTLEFEYHFTANGQQYRGREITFDSNTTQSITFSQSAANELQVKYPKDSLVTVHYDPQNPYDSVLETQVGNRTWTLLAIAAILTIIGTPFFVLYLRALRWQRAYWDASHFNRGER